ncbi:nitroreductase family protein [Pseudobacteriovorax antillogorgiicola]|uniref:Putative NAD(P)H nitroreductase n=1 Tax=Pseudobacteriovorax antillogorgiicola TaxID=1513793 RepID=A0A1Y6CEV2_9BACT|nr:nitroreductase [Pseudobacteriovorax antillogorgiicola]TCS47563.1 nitroreductase [Pseudobacteriovorax antillogorgiicola]SMF60523.1 Nitroreductase [Pseudobacteriovorax antillogorgiicola]
MPLSDDPLHLMMTRKSTSLLEEPVPSPEQLKRIIHVACTAPDHGCLEPYRFVVVQGEARLRLADAFAATLKREQPDAPDAKIEKARSKALVAPMQIFIICSPKAGKIPLWEQQATAACAGFGLTIGAHGLGFGAIWKSFGLGIGPELDGFLALSEGESVLGWVNVGTPKRFDDSPRRDVDVDAKLTVVTV